MKLPMKTAALVAGLAATIGARAQDIPVDKYLLSNGMTVILREDHTVPLVTVNTWYKVGSKDEPPHHSGFAHLFEHLMFMGTRRVPTGQFDQVMEGGGGENNASTAEDRTNYYDSGPSNLLPILLWLEADRLQDLGRTMTLAKLNLQRDVVKNERRQNTENTPYGSAYEAINGLMFPPGHPYHTSVIGSMTDLDNASVQDVQRFFGEFYVPNNASMVVAGDFHPAEIKPLIENLFGTLPRRPDPARKPVPPIKPLGIKRLTMRDKVQLPKILLVWRSPAAYQPGDIEMQLAASVLGDGVNSRLYRRLVAKDKLATAVTVFQEQRLLGSLFHVDITAEKGANLKLLLAATDDEIQKFRKLGPRADELRRQSAKIESGTLNALQSIGNVADELNEYQFYLGQPNSFQRVLQQFRAAEPDQVRRVAARTMEPANRLELTVLPTPVAPPAPVVEGAAPMRFAGVVHVRRDPRDKQPRVGPAKPFIAPRPVVLKLRNGIPMYYWRRSTLPLMSVDLQFLSGADADEPAQDGLAQLTATLLTQGAGSRDSQAFQDALDLLGADLSANAGHRRDSVRMNVLASHFEPAAKLLADAVLRPRFDPAEFDRVKRVTIADLAEALDNVSATANRVALRQFFGAENPTGRPIAGTQATVASLTREQVRLEHTTQYRPNLARFYVAGSMPAKKVQAIMDKAFGEWSCAPLTGQGSLQKESPAEPGSAGIRLFLVDKPRAVQTAIRFLMPAPRFDSPDRLKFEELGTILGGSFTSRLNQNLREDKGYTYGASASFYLQNGYGYCAASASVRADATGASINEFLKEFNRIRAGDISEREVAKATATIRTADVTALSTLAGLLGVATGLAQFGMPIEMLATDERRRNSIVASDLNQLAKTGLPYERGVLVLVGDKTLILKELEGLKLPAPTEVEAQ